MTGLHRLSMIGLSALSLGLVAAALVLVGGPGRARAELRDSARLADLRIIEQHAQCLARHDIRGTLPLPTTASCPGPVPQADAAGAPYRIEPLDDGNLRLCASFELGWPEHTQLYGRIAATQPGADQNCMVVELPRGLASPDALPLPGDDVPASPPAGPSLVPLN